MRAIGGAWIAVIVLVSGTVGELGAQQSEAERAPEREMMRMLTLEEALQLAAGHNPDYRRALNEVELNPTAARAAWASLMPSLNLSTSTGTGFSQSTREVDFFGNPIENPDPGRNYSSSATQSLSLSWSFQGLGARHEMTEARAGNRVRELQRDVRRHALEIEVTRSFFEAQEREELLALEEEMLEGRRRDLEASERLYALARHDRTDVLGAELEVSRQLGNIEEARGELQKALLALGGVVGAPDLEEVRIAPEPLEVFDPEAVSVAGLVAAALDASPRLREQEALLDERRAARGSARSSRLPELSVGAGISRGATGLDQQAFLDINPRDSRSGNFNVSISIPLQQTFLSGAHQEQQAEVGVRNQTETLRETRVEVEEQVRVHLIDLATAFRRVELRERERELAEERLRLTQEGYRMARRTFEELQSALRDAADARREALSARYAFVRARLDLEESVGHGLDPMLGLVP